MTGNYFDLLGVTPAAGRLLTPEDDRAGAAPVGVVSQRLWRDHLGGQSIVGRPLTLGTAVFTVVGVVPDTFRGLNVSAVDVWAPSRTAMRTPAELWTDHDYRAFDIVARLRAGIAPSTAQHALDAVHARVPELTAGDTHVLTAPVTRLFNGYRDADQVRTATLLMLGAAVVALLTCVAVASLFAVRGLQQAPARRVHVCLGATRGRVLLSATVESSLLAAAIALPGGLVGMLLTRLLLLHGSAGAVLGIDAHQVADPLRQGLVILAGAIAFAAAGSLTTGLQSLRARTPPGTSQLASRGSTSGLRAATALLATQVALTLVLVSVGSHIVLEFTRRAATDVGFEPTDTVSVTRLEVFAPDATVEQQDAILEQLLERGRAEVWETSSIAAMVPMSRSSLQSIVSRPATGNGEPVRYRVSYNPISPEYFESVGVRVLQGRPFGPSDRRESEGVAIASQSLARTLWADRSPLGQTLLAGPNGRPLTIVGVAGDVRYASPLEPVSQMLYVPFEQREFGSLFHLVTRAAGPVTAATASRIDALIRGVAPQSVPSPTQTLKERTALASATPRFLAMTLSLFGLMGVALASVSTYSLFQFSGRARRREFGVRLALGASSSNLFWVVMRHAATVAGVGVGAGLLLLPLLRALGASAGVSVPIGSWFTVGTMGLLMMGVALLSAMRSAWGATSRVPLDAIRHE